MALMRTEDDGKWPPELRHPEIVIDEKPYRAPSDDMSGAQLRHLARPPISEDRDLWLEREHGDDELIGDEHRLELRSGMRFFSTPKHINPGSVGTSSLEEC